MTSCTACKKDLSTVSEIHACNGKLYCSKDCAISDIMHDIIRDVKGTAEHIYTDNSEVVLPEDIGIKDYTVVISTTVVIRSSSPEDAIQEAIGKVHDGTIDIRTAQLMYDTEED